MAGKSAKRIDNSFRCEHRTCAGYDSPVCTSDIGFEEQGRVTDVYRCSRNDNAPYTRDTLPNSTEGQYLATMTKLISSAENSLFIQLQYIEASKGTGDYDALLRAIANRVKASVDARPIEDQQNGEKWAEKMKASGVDLTANIRLQASPSVHNKGSVVDAKTVVVSSQNFSPASVQTN